MRSIVMGLVASVVHARGEGIGGRETRFGDERRIASRVADQEVGEATAALTAVVESPVTADAQPEQGAPVAGDWEVACELKSGSALVFERGSVREYGAVTLFRWAAARTPAPDAVETIFTAVANCREKTIEAAWPGKRTETRAGSCGRRLDEAVCARAGQTIAPVRGRRPGPAGTRRGGEAGGKETPADDTTPRR
jgi:hypothetical protein